MIEFFCASRRLFKHRLPTLAAVLAFAILATECCHNASHGKRKRATNTSTTTTEGVFFPICLANVSNRAVQWGGPVNYVLNSEWYATAQQTCSVNLGTDTPACWLQVSNLLISRNSSLLNQVKMCIVQYTMETRGEQYEGDFFDSDIDDDPFDDDLCPDVEDSEFITDFMQEITGMQLDDDSDDIVNELQSVIDVIQADIICPTCTCRNLSENIGSLEEYDFETTSLECNQCWTTRIGSLARRGFSLTRPFGLTSVRVDNLRAIDNCMGDFIEQDDPDLETSLDANVICESNRITVRIDRCTLVNLGLDFIEEFVIADRNENFTEETSFDPECVPELYDNPSFDDVEFIIPDDFNTCGADIEENSTHIRYTYYLRANADDVLRGPVSHFGDFCLEFSCVYPIKYKLVNEVPLKPIIRKTELELKTGFGEFDIDLVLHQSPSYMEPFEPPSGQENPIVFVPDPIYPEIIVRRPIDNMVLVVDTCRASNTNPPTPGTQGRFVLIKNNCPDNLVTSVVEHTDDEFRFQFFSFYWNNETLEQLIYITCDVWLCNSGIQDCTIEECPDRRKRSVQGEEVEENSRQYSRLVVGPLQIVTNKGCSKNNGGCSHVCVQLKNRHHCKCREGYELLEDGRNCVDEAAALVLHKKTEEKIASKRMDLSTLGISKLFESNETVLLCVGAVFLLLLGFTVYIMWKMNSVLLLKKRVASI